MRSEHEIRRCLRWLVNPADVEEPIEEPDDAPVVMDRHCAMEILRWVLEE